MQCLPSANIPLHALASSRATSHAHQWSPFPLNGAIRSLLFGPFEGFSACMPAQTRFMWSTWLKTGADKGNPKVSLKQSIVMVPKDANTIRVQGLGSGALGRGPNRLERSFYI